MTRLGSKTAALTILFAGGGVALAQGVSALPWSWNPAVVAGLLYAGLFYGVGVAKLWRRAGVGRGVQRWRVVAFVGALLTLVVALLSPLEAATSLLFSAHMLQHLLLIIVVAPLAVLGLPLLAGLWALPLGWRRRIGGGWRQAGALRAFWHALTHPAVTWTLYLVVFWAWHVPALYELALRYEVVHVAEHATLLGVAGLFWWTLLHPLGRWRMGRGAGILYLFGASLQGGALGALIVFSNAPWYPAYVATAETLGRSALQDQQAAGLIMWIPLGTLYVVLTGVFVLLWLKETEGQMRATEARRHQQRVRGDVCSADNSLV